MIHHAIEKGVNYFDTAYVYHGGQSEVFLGKALRDQRSRVRIATKSPVWLIRGEADFDRYLKEQLAGSKPTTSTSTCSTPWTGSVGETVPGSGC